MASVKEIDPNVILNTRFLSLPHKQEGESLSEYEKRKISYIKEEGVEGTWNYLAQQHGLKDHQIIIVINIVVQHVVDYESHAVNPKNADIRGKCPKLSTIEKVLQELKEINISKYQYAGDMPADANQVLCEYRMAYQEYHGHERSLGMPPWLLEKIRPDIKDQFTTSYEFDGWLEKLTADIELLKKLTGTVEGCLPKDKKGASKHPATRWLVLQLAALFYRFSHEIIPIINEKTGGGYTGEFHDFLTALNGDNLIKPYSASSFRRILFQKIDDATVCELAQKIPVPHLHPLNEAMWCYEHNRRDG